MNMAQVCNTANYKTNRVFVFIKMSNYLGQSDPSHAISQRLFEYHCNWVQKDTHGKGALDTFSFISHCFLVCMYVCLFLVCVFVCVFVLFCFVLFFSKKKEKRKIFISLEVYAYKCKWLYDQSNLPIQSSTQFQRDTDFSFRNHFIKSTS